VIPERPSAKTALPLWPLRVGRGRSPSEEPRSQKGGLLPLRCDPLGRQDSSTSIGDLLCLLYVCAVQRRRFPVGASPTRRPLQPEATGAVMEVTKWLKPSV
jgi:hypothetical protein